MRRGVFETIEATASVFFAFMVGFVLLVFGAAVVLAAKGDADFRWLLPVWGAMVMAEGVFLYWLKNSLELGLRPFIPLFALGQVQWPILLKPFIAGWWLVHFLAAVAGLFGTERLLFQPGEDLPIAVLGAALAIFAWMLTHCSLLYLFLAVTSVLKSKRLIELLWRRRLLIDLLVTVAVVCASYQFAPAQRATMKQHTLRRAATAASR